MVTLAWEAASEFFGAVRAVGLGRLTNGQARPRVGYPPEEGVDGATRCR